MCMKMFGHFDITIWVCQMCDWQNRIQIACVRLAWRVHSSVHRNVHRPNVAYIFVVSDFVSFSLHLLQWGFNRSLICLFNREIVIAATVPLVCPCIHAIDNKYFINYAELPFFFLVSFVRSLHFRIRYSMVLMYVCVFVLVFVFIKSQKLIEMKMWTTSNGNGLWICHALRASMPNWAYALFGLHIP